MPTIPFLLTPDPSVHVTCSQGMDGCYHNPANHNLATVDAKYLPLFRRMGNDSASLFNNLMAEA